MNETLWLWIGFNLFVLAMLALDLGVVNRRAHVVTIGESLAWTGVWVTLAMLFNFGVWHFAGEQKGLEFLTGYLIEKSLSVDNLFVFALVFSYFGVEPKYQHKVLFWGILGALLMRAAMIALGTSLIHRFSWVLYVFGGFLVLTGLRMALRREIAVDPERNPVVQAFRALVPVTRDYHAQRFCVREGGRLCATPLLVVLVCVEVTDLMFATDSIPAIFAVTLDPFIVYTSNVFAVLGLRSLYFALAGMMGTFRFLKYGLSLILIFIGLKMLLAHTALRIGTLPALVVVVAVLASSVLISLLRPRGSPAKASTAEAHPLAEQ